MKKITTICCLCVWAFVARAQEEVNYVYMDSLFQQLPEVMVKGERPVVKAERGKLVYDLPRLVEKLVVTNAYEVVKELPGVVEQEGTLTLGGRPLTVVINGKVSTLGAEEIKTLLQNTPVERLEQAEVMYAAPARYRVRGAMVNVVLKRGLGQPASWSGEVSGTAEQSRRASASGRGNLLYTSGRLSVDGMYAYGRTRSAWGLNKQSQHTVDGQLHELALQTRASGHGNRHDWRLGVDYDLGRKQTLNLVYNGQFRDGEDRTVMRGTAHSDRVTDGTRQLHQAKADYQSAFGLSAGVDYLHFASPEHTWLQKTMQSEVQQVMYDSRQRIDRWLGYLHQSHTLAKGPELNYGVKYTTTRDHSFQRADGTAEPSADASSGLLRTEQTLNLYAGASHTLGKLSGECSLAAEYYHARGYHSWMLYPVLNLTYTPADGHTVQGSFTSNRNFPDYWQLQPIVQYVDSYTEAHGNPDLKPSSEYAVDLNYLYRNRHLLGINYSHTHRYFVQLPYQLPNRLAEVNQVVNYDFQRQWTLHAMTSFRVGDWWNGRVSMFGLLSHDKHTHFHDASFNRHRLSVILHTTHRFTLAKRPNLVGQLTGFYQSPAIQGLYNLAAICNLSASLQWVSANDRMRVVLQGNDLLQTSNMVTRVDWGRQQSRTELNWDRRSVSLTASYRLGSYKEKKRDKVDTSRLGR